MGLKFIKYVVNFHIIFLSQLRLVLKVKYCKHLLLLTALKYIKEVI